MARRLIVMAVAVLVLAASAEGQTRAGIRAGVSADPDQFFFGGHMETRPLMDRLTFRPNAEIGIGDDATLIALNLEFAYRLTSGNTPWAVYVGAGPAVNIYSYDNGQHGNDDGDVGGGFNILLGAEHSGGLFTELKVGTIDSPNLKVTVGYVFK